MVIFGDFVLEEGSIRPCYTQAEKKKTEWFSSAISIGHTVVDAAGLGATCGG